MNTGIMLTGTLALFLVVGLGTPAFAEPITFEFEMEVTDIEIFDLGTSTELEIGDTVSGSFTFDSDASDSNPDPEFGAYPIEILQIEINGKIYESNPPFPINNGIFISNILFDQYSVADNTLKVPDEDLFAFFFFTFRDFDATLFSDDSLPLTPPSLDGLELNFFQLQLTDDPSLAEGASFNPLSEDLSQIQQEGIIVSHTGFLASLTLQQDLVGGELMPIETTSLLVSSAQSFSWMIPVVLSVLGIGLFIVSRKSE